MLDNCAMPSSVKVTVTVTSVNPGYFFFSLPLLHVRYRCLPTASYRRTIGSTSKRSPTISQMSVSIHRIRIVGVHANMRISIDRCWSLWAEVSRFQVLHCNWTVSNWSTVLRLTFAALSICNGLLYCFQSGYWSSCGFSGRRIFLTGGSFISGKIGFVTGLMELTCSGQYDWTTFRRQSI